MHAARVTDYPEPVSGLSGGLGTELNSGLNGGLNGGLDSGLSSGLEFVSSFSLDSPTAVDSRKRILMLSVSAGNGHVRAAEALVAHARADFPAISVRHQDVLQLVPRWFSKIYRDVYMALAHRLPDAWGWLYRATDAAAPGSFSIRARKALQTLCASRLLDEIRRYQPDMIICTHFLPAEILADARFKQQVTCPIWVQVTDFDLHPIWVQPGISGYFVANDELAYRLYAQGVPSSRVVVTGIPLMPGFAMPPDRSSVSRQLGFDPQKTTLLMMNGGAGAGLQQSLVQSLLNQHSDLQLIVLTGRNNALRESLQSIEALFPTRLRALGFVDDVYRLMACADLAITKPGGLSTSECLAMGLPMLLVNPIPGQEERNAAWLIQEGAALRADDPATLQFRLQRLLNDRHKLEAMRNRARTLAKPFAAREVLQLARTVAR
jgi:processive 1,2-diacylglycerol beta-glucosyltransferase